MYRNKSHGRKSNLRTRWVNNVDTDGRARWLPPLSHFMAKQNTIIIEAISTGLHWNLSNKQEIEHIYEAYRERVWSNDEKKKDSQRCHHANPSQSQREER